MSRKIFIILIIFQFFTVLLFAENNFQEPELQVPEFTFLAYFAAEDSSIIHAIRNNQFFLESLRLSKLAQDAYEYGDYDASTAYAEEAIRYAQLSDEYVAEQLIAEAKRLLDWADNNDIPSQFPNNYNEGKNYYETAVVAHSNEALEESIDAATKAIEILSVFETAALSQIAGGSSTTGGSGSSTTGGSGSSTTGGSGSSTTGGSGTSTTGEDGTSSGSPRQYVVRTWIVERDCLWNIAGYPWVFGDPWRWPELYEANKHKMPDPNNPHWIEPGMVLDIPDR
jgi:nucleoid-associated protein YgaU